MSRYQREDNDQAIIDAGYPQTVIGNTDLEVRRAVDDARANFYRCGRRLYLSKLLEDADALGLGSATPELYSSAIIAMAIYDIELVVNE